MIRTVAIFAICCVFTLMQAAQLHAASPELINKLEESITSSPKIEKINDGHFKLSVDRRDGNGKMTLVSQTLPGGGHAFGVEASYVVGAVESNYPLDTPCEVFLVSSKGDGSVDVIKKWNCIAFTSTMESFVNDKAKIQQVFDRLVEEAGELMQVK